MSTKFEHGDIFHGFQLQLEQPSEGMYSYTFLNAADEVVLSSDKVLDSAADRHAEIAELLNLLQDKAKYKTTSQEGSFQFTIKKGNRKYASSPVFSEESTMQAAMLAMQQAFVKESTATKKKTTNKATKKAKSNTKQKPAVKKTKPALKSKAKRGKIALRARVVSYRRPRYAYRKDQARYYRWR